MRSKSLTNGPAFIAIGIGAVAAMAMLWGRQLPGVVEMYYSTGIYPWMATGLSTVFSMVPISCAQLTVVAMVLGVIAVVVRRSILWGVGAVSLLYASFVGLWGLNYARLSLEERFGLAMTIDDDATNRVLSELAVRTNDIRGVLAASNLHLQDVNDDPEAQDVSVARLQASVLRGFGLPAVTSGRVKALYPGDLLQRLGYSGLFWPWTGEPNVNNPMAPGQLAAVIAHERAHLSGFASETEANFIAFITTSSSASAAVQYSGLLSFWRYVRSRHVPLRSEVWADIGELDAFWRRGVNKAAKQTADRAYDSYLKASGEAHGIRSYARGAEVIIRYLNKFGYPQVQP